MVGAGSGTGEATRLSVVVKYAANAAATPINKENIATHGPNPPLAIPRKRPAAVAKFTKVNPAESHFIRNGGQCYPDFLPTKSGALPLKKSLNFWALRYIFEGS